MSDGQDGAGKIQQQRADDRGGQGRQVAGGLVQEQHVCVLQDHPEEKQLGLLPARK